MEENLKKAELNREGGRGASQDAITQGQQPQASGSYSFFGDASGRNDCGNAPADRGHAKPTL